MIVNAPVIGPGLTEWLIEYNFNRPHQSLGYLAPIVYIEKELAKIRSPVLPMWSASTLTCPEDANTKGLEEMI